MALSDRGVKNAKAGSKPYKLSDGDAMYLLVSHNGSKLWRMNYRFQGKQKTLALGQYPEITLLMARNRCREAKQLLAEGVDPGVRKKEAVAEAKASASVTFRAAADEYLAALVGKGMSEATIDKNRWVLGIACAKMGSRSIADIKAKDILELLQDIEKSGRLETARRTRTCVGSVFRLAILKDFVMADPTVALRGAIKSPTVEHHPAVVVPDRFANLLAAIDGYGGSVVVRSALQALALTFVRPGELRFAVWSEMDLEDGIWRIPGERTKMRRPLDVPITSQFRKILTVMAKCSRRDSFVFPSPRSLFEPISENTMNQALNRLGYKGEHTAHGFRSSASTMLNEMGYREDVIEFQLGHIEENEVRRAYNRALYWDERVMMMRNWARRLDELRIV